MQPRRAFFRKALAHKCFINKSNISKMLAFFEMAEQAIKTEDTFFFCGKLVAAYTKCCGLDNANAVMGCSVLSPP